MAEPQTPLFEMLIRVRPGPRCEMPGHLKGADVICFVGAPDHLTAVRMAVQALQSRGYVFEDLVNQKVKQLEQVQWTEYLQAAWGDLSEQFPEQTDAIRQQFPDAASIQQLMSTSGVAFGPFLCWETDS